MASASHRRAIQLARDHDPRRENHRHRRLLVGVVNGRPAGASARRRWRSPAPARRSACGEATSSCRRRVFWNCIRSVRSFGLRPHGLVRSRSPRSARGSMSLRITSNTTPRSAGVVLAEAHISMAWCLIVLAPAPVVTVVGYGGSRAPTSRRRAGSDAGDAVRIKARGSRCRNGPNKCGEPLAVFGLVM